MKYSKNYCEEKEISTSELNEAQRTLYYIAENMKMDKSISEEGYRHFQMAIQALEQQPSLRDKLEKEYLVESLTEDLQKLYAENEELHKKLEQQPSEDCISRESVIEWLKNKDIIKMKKQEENARRELATLPSVTPQIEPCEDCISRQAAINTAISAADDWDGGCDAYREEMIREALEALPPVTPQRPNGKWIEIEIDAGEFIYKCTKCGMRVINPYKYCPNCGAEMGGAE